MLDPTTLQPGQRVRAVVTGCVEPVACEVTAEKDHGWAVLRVTEEGWPASLLLRCEDYIPLEIL